MSWKDADYTRCSLFGIKKYAYKMEQYKKVWIKNYKGIGVCLKYFRGVRR